MRKSTIKQISLAVCLVLMPYSIYAAGLGELEISSGLGEPFIAEIELLSVSPEEFSSLVASIASEEAYAAQGITRLGVHNTIQVELAKNIEGSPILKLRSSQAISDPYLDMLIQVDWATGRLQREYTVLLDPPGYKSATDNAAEMPVTLPSTRLPSNNDASGNLVSTSTDGADQAELSQSRKTRKSKAQKTATADEFTNTAVAPELRTKAGDSLSLVAKALQVESVSLDQMLVGLYESNQQAFLSGNMNLLKVGQIIKVPTKESLVSITAKEARNIVKVHSSNWNAYRNDLAGSVTTAAVMPEAEQKQSASGKISTAKDNATPVKVGAQDVVKLSAGEKESGKAFDAKIVTLQEEATARDKALKEAEGRTLALEKQIQDMQKLLALKNQSMVDLQKNVEATVKKPVSKPSVKPTPSLQSETDFIEYLMSLVDSTVLSGALVPVLLGAGWFFLRNKRRKALAGGILTTGDLKVSAVFGNTAADASVEEDVMSVEDPAGATLAAEHLLDFDLTNVAGDPIVSAVISDANNPPVVENSQSAPLDVNFNLTEAEVEAASEQNLTMDSSAIDDISFDLNFSAEVPSPSDNAAADLNVAEISFDLPDMDIPEVSAVESSSKSDEVEANRFDLSSISLDLAGTENELTLASSVVPEVVEPGDITSESPDINSKLDLVVAYIEMDDKEGARELLLEVIKEGGVQKKLRAQHLLDRLA